MSRSGYVDDCETINLYRAAVERSIKGKRGQAFLRELAEAMDAMPEKVLIAGDLITIEGHVCAIGAVCKKSAVDISTIDPDEPEDVARAVGIARSMAAEISYMNDEFSPGETPENRWQRMRNWVQDHLRE